MFIFDRGTGAQQFKGLVMSETHRRRPRRYKFEVSFVGNGRRPTQKSGTRREKRNAPDSPELIVPVHPRRLGISTISSFHLLAKSGTVGKR